jgi:pimeloyl-ACP methyl ester carboxylesterase
MQIETTNSEATPQPTSVSRKRGCLFYARRGLLVLVILLIGLPLTGFVYETIMASGDAQRYPPPGQLVAVNEHKMHLNCTGQGSPTVVLEAGANDCSATWVLVQPSLSQTTRVCSYDRSGFGWSEPGPEVRSPQQIATELHTLLANAGVPSPYVLVGHSNGGKYVRMFASLYPADVIGMVLVDARHESLEPHDRTPEQNARDSEAYRSSLRLYAILGRLGVVRLFGVPLVQSLNPPIKNLPADIIAQYALSAVQQKTLDAMVTEGEGGLVNDDQLAAAKLGNLPLVVLTAKYSMQMEPRWEKAQQALAALSTNSRWTIVEQSTHMIHWEQPSAVVDAVRDVIRAAQTGTMLTQ